MNLRSLFIIVVLVLQFISTSIGQHNGTIEAEKITADSLIGDGSRITGIQSQNLVVSESGDTLHITEGNWVLIPGLSTSNSGNAFANAGVDIINACQTSFNLSGSLLSQSQSGLWTIESGTGGNLVNATHPNAQFIGQEGEAYVLKWTVMEQGGSSSFDQLNISIAVNTETSLADAGQDLFAIMTQTVTLNGNAPEMGSNGQWEVLEGIGGLLGNIADPLAVFTGVPGQSYTLRWQHFNNCSTSSDEVILSFSESASGVPSSNGRYFIPDPKFRQYLQILFPSTMDGDSLILATVHEIETVDITQLDVYNLDGLQFLNAVKHLILDQNQNLTSIPSFPDSLINFSCNDCSSLGVIPIFPNDLDTLMGSGWPAKSIPNFPVKLRSLFLANAQISKLPDFPSSLRSIYLSGLPDIVQLPNLPDSCEFVEVNNLGDIYGQEVFNDTFNIPLFAHEFVVQEINITSFPTLPLDKSNLEILNIRSTFIETMPSLADCPTLKKFYLKESRVLKLEELPINLEEINIEGNPILCVENKPPLVVDQLSEYDLCPEN